MQAGGNKILRLVAEDLAQEQLAGASKHTIRNLRAGRRGNGPIALPKKRIQLGIAQGWRCHWCQQACREDVGWLNSATLDHIVPRCQGGPNEPWNLVMSCQRCNTAKGNRSWEDFELVARGFAADARPVGEARIMNKRAAKQRRRERQQQVVQLTWFDRLAMLCGSWARAIPA